MRTPTPPTARRIAQLLTALFVAALIGELPASSQTPTQPGQPPRATAVQPDMPAARGRVVPEVSRACWYVFQAKNGDYWFGSDGEGAYRYDGKTIVNYTTADGLSGLKIRGILEDKAANVFFTAEGGICRFDGRAFSTVPLAETPADGGWRLHPDDLWFPSNGPSGPGPYRYDGTSLYKLKLPKSDLEPAFRAAVPNARYSPYDVFSIYRDSRGHVWIGTSNFGVCRYDGRSFGWLHEEHLIMAPNGGLFGLRSVIEDKDGVYWICNTKHRFRVGPENAGEKVAYTREDGIDVNLSGGEEVYFQGALADAQGDLWFSPWGGGIWRYDGKTMTNYPVKDDGKDTQVVSIFKDNGGAMWLGTPTAGPYRFNGEGFEKFRP